MATSLRIPTYQQQQAPSSLGYTAEAFAPRTRGLDLEPLARAIGQVSDLHARQLEHERALKVKTAIGQASLELKRATLELETDGDPLGRPARFAERKQKIMEATLRQLDGTRGEELFRQEFEGLALGEEFALRKAAVKETQERQHAGMEINLETYADLAARGSPEQAETFKTQGLLAITDAVAAGVIDPVSGVKRAQKFRSDVVSAQVRQDIFTNPHAAEEKLLQGGYEDLDPEQRTIWLERASTRAEARERQALAAEDRALRLSEKAEREQQDVRQKEGDRLLAQGQLTPDWIEQNRDRLSAEDYRYFYRQLTDEGSSSRKTDPTMYSDLRLRAGQGEDVRAEARQALQHGLIKTEDFDRLTKLSEDAGIEGALPNWFKRGEAHITNALKPSDLNDDPAAPQRFANAMDDWNAWARKNPNASEEEASKRYQSLVRDYALVQWDQMTLTMRRPRHLVGGLQAPDLDATEDALLAEFEAKHAGDMLKVAEDPDFLEQAAIVEQWRRALERSRANAAPAEGED